MFKTAILATLLASASAFTPSQFNGMLYPIQILMITITMLER